MNKFSPSLCRWFVAVPLALSMVAIPASRSNAQVEPLAATESAVQPETLSKLYAEWMERSSGIYGMAQSNPTVLFDEESFIKLRRQGAKAVAFFLEKLEKGEDFGSTFQGEVGVNSVMAAISQTGFHYTRVPTPEDPKLTVYHPEEFPTMEMYRRPGQAKELWMKWWDEKDRKIPIWFRGRYQMWQTAKKAGDAEKTALAFRKLKSLGIFALPQWMEKLDSDKSETKAIIGAISELSSGEVAPDATIAQVKAWWKENKDKWTSAKPIASTAEKKPTDK